MESTNSTCPACLSDSPQRGQESPLMNKEGLNWEVHIRPVLHASLILFEFLLCFSHTATTSLSFKSQRLLKMIYSIWTITATSRTCAHDYFFKVWWHAATLFIYFYINRADIQYFYVPETHIMYFIQHCRFLKCSEEGLLGGGGGFGT